MKKLLLVGLLVLMPVITGATTIRSENITADLGSSMVEADLEIEELTTSKFTYTTSHDIRNLEVRIEGERTRCNVERLQIGSEIKCPADQKKNLTVDMTFVASGISENQNGLNLFRYRKSFSSPTQSFSMDVVLPPSTGLVDQKNVSTPVVLPPEYEVGSTGRRITVSWDIKPQLGESVEFRVMSEKLSDRSIPYENIIIGAFLILILASISYIVYRKLNLSEIENIYGELSEDEIELLELLRENEGELLQKDAVDNSTYSKAKISEVVSSLVEKDVIVKEKEGRSNKLKIRKNYKY